MPSKSRRNRRAISQRAISQSRREITSTVLPDAENTAPISKVQSDKVTASYTSASRGAATAPITYVNFFKELKWIGITTGIIVILLIISYIIFK